MLKFQTKYYIKTVFIIKKQLEVSEVKLNNSKVFCQHINQTSDYCVYCRSCRRLQMKRRSTDSDGNKNVFMTFVFEKNKINLLN